MDISRLLDSLLFRPIIEIIKAPARIGSDERSKNSRFLHCAVAGAPAPVGMTNLCSGWGNGFGRDTFPKSPKISDLPPGRVSNPNDVTWRWKRRLFSDVRGGTGMPGTPHWNGSRLSETFPVRTE